MGKIIYLEPTLNLLIERDGLETVKQMTESGQIKTIETDNGNINYLVIEDGE